MAYQVRKDPGSSAPVTVVNIDTGSSVILGVPSIPMLEVLRAREGYSTSADDESKRINMYDIWNLEVREDTAKELARSVVRGSRPKRVTQKKEVEQPKDNRQINAMDVLLGLAKYNK